MAREPTWIPGVPVVIGVPPLVRRGRAPPGSRAAWAPLRFAFAVALFTRHPMRQPRATGIAAPLHGDLVEVTPAFRPGGRLGLRRLAVGGGMAVARELLGRQGLVDGPPDEGLQV